MITNKMVIEFHEQRLKSTIKIIETLRELKETNLMTHLIDSEIQIHEGERDFTNETLMLLKQEENENKYIKSLHECFLHTHEPNNLNDGCKDDNVIFLGETKCGKVIQGVKEGNEVVFRVKGSDLLEVLDRVKEKNNIPRHRNPPNPPAK